MSSSSKDAIDIIYNKKLLFKYPYTSSSTLKDLKQYISSKYFLKLDDIILMQNASQLNDDNIQISLLAKISKK